MSYQSLDTKAHFIPGHVWSVVLSLSMLWASTLFWSPQATANHDPSVTMGPLSMQARANSIHEAEPSCVNWVRSAQNDFDVCDRFNMVASSGTPNHSPQTASNTPGDEYWVPGFGPSGVDSEVWSLAVTPDGSVYAGGSFITAGEILANRVARWDGTAWHSLGGGIGGTTYPWPRVYALAASPDGSLYVGGDFTTAGGLQANSIARWDPMYEMWFPLASGISGGDSGNPGVHALAQTSDGSIYAGGDFSTADGLSASEIARWDGRSWSTLGSGIGGVPYAVVHAIAVGQDGSIFAGGYFTTAGGVQANYIARWDGTSWYPMGGGMNGRVRALTFGPGGSLYAGGDFTSAGNVAANHVAQWDGISWHPVGSGIDGAVNAMAFGSNGLLYAGGYFTTAGGNAATYVAQWNGTVWEEVGGGMDEQVFALVARPDDSLFAGGRFNSAGSTVASSIARWIPSQVSWSSLGDGNGLSAPVTTFSLGQDGSLYAGGHFHSAGASFVNYIGQWNGSAWSSLGEGVDDRVFSLAVGPDGSMYAGGWFNTAGGVSTSHIARWDGSSWFALGSGTNDTVGALVVGSDGVYAGGGFTSAGGVPANYIARWDGSFWHPLGTGLDDWVSALAIGPDGSLYVGGYFNSAGGTMANYIARWDGISWHSLGTGVGGVAGAFVNTLAFGMDGSLYAGGYFTTAGVIPVNNIARWDGSSWHALGYGTNYPIFELAISPDGSLFAGGVFSIAGGAPANNIAHWDGISWHPLGSGIAYTFAVSVNALAVDPDGSLYVGGNFMAAGGKPASRIAHWRGGSRYKVWLPLLSLSN